jgi:hypothetical protein
MLLDFLQDRVSLATSLSAAVAARSAGTAVAAAQTRLGGKGPFLVLFTLFVRCFLFLFLFS